MMLTLAQSIDDYLAATARSGVCAHVVEKRRTEHDR